MTTPLPPVAWVVAHVAHVAVVLEQGHHSAGDVYTQAEIAAFVATITFDNIEVGLGPYSFRWFAADLADHYEALMLFQVRLLLAAIASPKEVFA